MTSSEAKSYGVEVTQTSSFASPVSVKKECVKKMSVKKVICVYTYMGVCVCIYGSEFVLERSSV